MPRTIIVPVDLSQQDAAARALVEARQYDPDGKLILLHVVPPVPNFVAAELPDDILRSRLVQVQKALRAFAQQAGVATEADVVIREGHPGREILGCADEVGADLIVMASNDPGWGDFLLGSAAAFVMRHAHCSVFVVRQHPGNSVAG
jgi:nucleotide-binding universal stress UspA family protein